MAALGMELPTFQREKAFDDLQECPAYKAVQDYLMTTQRAYSSNLPLWTWNDRHAKNKADVITVLRAAARREKKKEDAQ